MADIDIKPTSKFDELRECNALDRSKAVVINEPLPVMRSEEIYDKFLMDITPLNDLCNYTPQDRGGDGRSIYNLIRRFIDYVMDFPCNVVFDSDQPQQQVHHYHRFGFLSHSLETARYCLDSAQRGAHLEKKGTYQVSYDEKQIEYTTMIAGLLHDLGRLMTHIHVCSSDGHMWDPYECSAEEFFKRYKVTEYVIIHDSTIQHRDVDHEWESVKLMKHLLREDDYRLMGPYSKYLDDAIFYHNSWEHPHDSDIVSIVKRADQASTSYDKQFKGDRKERPGGATGNAIDPRASLKANRGQAQQATVAQETTPAELQEISEPEEYLKAETWKTLFKWMAQQPEFSRNFPIVDGALLAEYPSVFDSVRLSEKDLPKTGEFFEKQCKEGYKQIRDILKEAGVLLLAPDGGDFYGVTDRKTGEKDRVQYMKLQIEMSESERQALVWHEKCLREG